MKLGPYLRDKREKEGITLKEMQEKSGLRKDIIKTLEKGNFNELPNPRYAPLLIEKYAKVLRLDSDQLMERFGEEFTYESETSGKKRKQTDNEDFQYLKKVFISFFVMILVLFVVWMVLLQIGSGADVFERKPIYETEETDDAEEAADNNDTEEETAEENNDEEENEEQPAEEEPSVDIDFIGTDNNTLTYQITTDEALTIALEGNSSWVSLTDDLGNTYAYEELESDEFEIDADANEVYLTIGNAEEFDVSVNGEALENNQAEDSITVYYQFNIEME
jgi:cytoskeletal protein RodZ